MFRKSLGALLLERLGRRLRDLALPVRERHEILVSAAERIWRPAPGCDLPNGAEKGRRLAELVVSMWHELGRPCSERAIDHALARAERRIAAHRDEKAVLVHGDVHEWNALEFATRRRPPRTCAPARPPHRSRRQGDLGVGRRRARVDRSARHAGRAPARCARCSPRPIG